MSNNTISHSSTLAVMFSDISGSTRLYETMGDIRALKCVARCMEVMGDVVARHQGRAIKSIGDELMSVFDTASAAAAAAMAMQKQLSEEEMVDGHRLAIRIGFQFGPVIETDGDVFGDGVNVAARLVGLARSGQIITTQESAKTLTEDLSRSVQHLNPVTVKGRQQEVAICELVWKFTEDATLFRKGSSTSVSAGMDRLTLIIGNEELPVTSGQGVVKLGRDTENDIVLEDRLASREHARIERHGNHFVLVDTSTNGTYLRFNDRSELKLLRDQVVLHGAGIMSFGHAWQDHSSDALAFRIQK